MPINTFAHGHILPYHSGFAHGKINTNQRFFKGSHLASLYITSSLLIGHKDVRHSLIYYGLLLVLTINNFLTYLLIWQTFLPNALKE